MSGIGILAYGSLIRDPGSEISPLIERRIPTTTPFPVEYGRLSETRGGGATVVPHSCGCPVKAEVLVLPDSLSLEEAKSLLWRRETRKERSGTEYRESSSPNDVVVRDERGFLGLDHVLYTDFNADGKLRAPDPRDLARAAVKSVATAPFGKDGISYLMDLISLGVITPLTPRYQEELLVQTHSSSLAEALDSARAGTNRD
jgi:hypothetical protein